MRSYEGRMTKRVYDTDGYRKHKRPDGWGSICPEDLAEDPQELLESGVVVGNAIYNVCGDYALRAQSHGEGRWHGHPIPWTRLPTAAKNALIEAGRLTSATFRKALRKKWGTEFSG